MIVRAWHYSLVPSPGARGEENANHLTRKEGEKGVRKRDCQECTEHAHSFIHSFIRDFRDSLVPGIVPGAGAASRNETPSYTPNEG